MKRLFVLCLSVAICGLAVTSPRAQTPAGTAFSYQGALLDSGAPSNGTYAMEFRLFDAESGGSQIGAALTLPSVAVSKGVFQTPLDFGAAPFQGEARWLDVTVNGISLSPRTALRPVPYALQAEAAATVPWSGVSGVPASLADGDDVDDADANPTNELNASLSLSGTTLQLTDAGGTLTADLSALDQSFDRIVIVHPGESIQAALDSITDASDTNAYLVRVEPGIYEGKVTMKSYVDVEGSGKGLTILTGTGGSSSPSSGGDSATVSVAALSELRHVTVRSVAGGANYALAVRLSGAGARATHVWAEASGGATSNIGIYAAAFSHASHCGAFASGTFATGVEIGGLTNTLRLLDTDIVTVGSGSNTWGVRLFGSTLEMARCSVKTSGATNNYGVWMSNNSTGTLSECEVVVDAGAAGGAGVRCEAGGTVTLEMRSCEIDALGSTANVGGLSLVSVQANVSNCRISGAGFGTGLQGGTLEVQNSDISGGTYSLLTFGSPTFLVATTRLEGPVNATGLTCVGAYDSGYAALDSTCQ